MAIRWVVRGLLLSMTLLLACTRSPQPLTAAAPPVPDWLTRLVAQFAHAPAGTRPGAVYRYVYRGQWVYYVPPGCCDTPGAVYDAAGTLLCAPDGGFTGTGDGRCPDFVTARQQGQRIWPDRRAP